jgi:hypothetical protein
MEQPMITAPARRTYAKEVFVDAGPYRATHNRDPRGYGLWAFAPVFAYHGHDPHNEPLPADQARAQLDALGCQIRGTYTEARAAAVRAYAQQGETRIAVLP